MIAVITEKGGKCETGSTLLHKRPMVIDPSHQLKRNKQIEPFSYTSHVRIQHYLSVGHPNKWYSFVAIFPLVLSALPFYKPSILPSMPQVWEFHAPRHRKNLENQKQKSAFIIKKKLVQECKKRTYPRTGTLDRLQTDHLGKLQREREKLSDKP